MKGTQEEQDTERIIEYLLKHEADVNARNGSGQSALHMAREPEVIEYLLKHGANIEATDKQHQTPLHIAVQLGCFSSIQCLIKNGTDVNARDKQKRTALHWAAGAGNVKKITAYLLKNGAELCPDEHGKTPFYYFLAYYQSLNPIYRFSDISEAAALKTIQSFLTLGAFLFQSLQIKLSQDAVPESIRLYDKLPAVLQAPIKAHYHSLIDKALQENCYLPGTVANLKDEASRYVLAAAFIEAQQALPRLLKQPPVELLQQPLVKPKYSLPYLPEEIWLEIATKLLMQLGIDPVVAPILAPESLARFRGQQNEITSPLDMMTTLSLR